jgi:hypothetical protein
MSKKESFLLAATLAAALTLSMLPRPGHAYTAEQQQYCSGDAFRLCGSEIPDVDRITACMIRNMPQGLWPGAVRKRARRARKRQAGLHSEIEVAQTEKASER